MLGADTFLWYNLSCALHKRTTPALTSLKHRPTTYTMVMEPYDITDDQNLFSCAICGLTEGDSSNLTTQNTLQTNATVGCGHQL